MRRITGIVVVLAALAAAPAQARVITIGSSLTAAARGFESAPVDSVYWNTKLAGHRAVRLPARGQVKTVRLKGRINPTGAAPPDVVMHIQVLRRVAGGRMKAIITSGEIPLPFGGRADRITTFHPYYMCARKGDFLALSTSGGYGVNGYKDGAQFAMFADVSGSAFSSFTGAGKDLNGAVFSGRPHAGRELLLQARIATGGDALYGCR